MDWDAVIDRNREALLGIVAALYALAGLENGAPATLPRHLVRALQRILRPAETAARRLIVIAAHSLAAIHPPVGAFLYGLDPARGHTAGKRGETGGGPAGIPAFALADPVKRFSPDAWHSRPRAVPRICTPGVTVPAPLPPLAAPDDPVGAGPVCRRLQALKRALEDIDGQARRLARWQARRERSFSSPARLSPIRNGRPPGLRKRPAHEAETLLDDLHALALHALAPPDTS